MAALRLPEPVTADTLVVSSSRLGAAPCVVERVPWADTPMLSAAPNEHHARSSRPLNSVANIIPSWGLDPSPGERTARRLRTRILPRNGSAGALILDAQPSELRETRVYLVQSTRSLLSAVAT